MEKETLTAFPLIGITVRTSNANGNAAKDIPELWERFNNQDISKHIPGILSADVYSVYTDYEGDHTQPYTTLIGYRVENLEYIPEGFSGIMIEAADYIKYTIEGNLLEGVVFNAWQEIWNSDLPRAYKADFEIYGAKSSDPKNAIVDIYLSVVNK